MSAPNYTNEGYKVTPNEAAASSGSPGHRHDEELHRYVTDEMPRATKMDAINGKSTNGSVRAAPLIVSPSRLLF